jgi:acyl dehydratase
MSALDLASVVGLELPGFGVTVERGALRFFAAAIGELDPVYSDVHAARAAGYRDLPAPPTYLFSLEAQRPAKNLVLDRLGVDYRRILHGEQRFDHTAVACAGDELDFELSIVDAYEKRQGALNFVVRQTVVRRSGYEIARLKNVLVITGEKRAS